MLIVYRQNVNPLHPVAVQSNISDLVWLRTRGATVFSSCPSKGFNIVLPRSPALEQNMVYSQVQVLEVRTRNPDLLGQGYIVDFTLKGNVDQVHRGWDEFSSATPDPAFPPSLVGFLPKGVCGQFVLHCAL